MSTTLSLVRQALLGAALLSGTCAAVTFDPGYTTGPAVAWAGGTMSVSVTCRGSEEFAGMLSAPWDPMTTFTADPILQLLDSAGVVVKSATVAGSTAEWYEGSSRTAGISFGPVSAGAYTLRGRNGLRQILVNGEGFSGFTLKFSSIGTPAPWSFRLSLRFSGDAHGEVMVMPPGDSFGSSTDLTFPSGTNITLRETPQPGAVWAGFNGAGIGGAEQIAFQLDADRTVDARFVLPEVANQAPTIHWTSSPGTVSSGTNYTVSAHADDDGNLRDIAIVRGGAPVTPAQILINKTAGDVGYTTSDINISSGNQTVTYTAIATDLSGAKSAVISQDVIITPQPDGVDATISAAVTTPVAPGAATLSWATTSALTANVTGPNGFSSSTRSGTQALVGLAAGDYTATISATGPANSSVERSTTFTIGAAGNVSADITATPSTVIEGGSVTIDWSSANATAVTVNGPGVSSSSANGRQTLSGLSTGSYDFTIRAEGEGGPAVRTANVVVTPAALVSAAISVSPSSTNAPGRAIVSWNSANANSVTVSGFGVLSSATTGSQNLTNVPEGTYVYTITAEGSTGTITKNATLIVGASTTVSGEIDVSPTSGVAPAAMTVSWSTTNASSATVTGTGVNSTRTSGSQAVSGLPAGSYTYTLLAQGNGGPARKTATFTVEPPTSNVSVGIGISPTQIVCPGAATLTWTSVNATSVSVTCDSIDYWSSTALNGSTQFTTLPPGRYTFTIVGQGPGGPASSSVVLDVQLPSGPGGRSLAINAIPAAIPWQGGISQIKGDCNVGGTGVLAVYRVHSTTTYVWAEIGEDDDGNPIYGTVPVTASWNALAYSASIWFGTGVNNYVLFGSFSAPSNLDPTSTIPYSVVVYGTDGRGGVGWTNIAVQPCTAKLYTLTTAVTGNGSVTKGGKYVSGTVVTVSATPSAGSQFAYWTGAATGSTPTAYVTMDADKVVTAVFTASNFTLSTAVDGPGSVTPGGSYAPNTWVTISAAANPGAKFDSWSGDATGSTNPLMLQMTSDKGILAHFSALLAQTITFPNPGKQPIGAVVPLAATASSGLPVVYTLISGPGSLSGGNLKVDAPGDITVQADQPGDLVYAPASPVRVTFNGYAAAAVKVLPNDPAVKIQNDRAGGAGQIR